MLKIYTHLLAGIESGQPLALATLIGTKGSTPQIPGASALFSADGLIAGTLGGGLLEADGQQRAVKALQSGGSMMYDYDLMADISDPEGAICGGMAVVLVDVQPQRHAEAFRNMLAALDGSRPGALLTCIGQRDGENVLLERQWVTATADGVEEADEKYRFHIDAIALAIAQRKPVTIEIGEKMFEEDVEETLLYVEPAYPVPQLIVTGAGHVGRAVAHSGRLLDFEVTVIDDRPEFANSGNIPDAEHFVVGDIGEAVGQLDISADTYIVIVNRGHVGDADALRQCIASDAAYIGLIGSRRKIEQMRVKFLEEGWATAEQFDRVHAPIGLEIDAKTVEEIAVSIAAELVAERRRRFRGEHVS